MLGLKLNYVSKSGHLCIRFVSHSFMWNSQVQPQESVLHISIQEQNKEGMERCEFQ